jgi:hypothetical protein
MRRSPVDGNRRFGVIELEHAVEWANKPTSHVVNRGNHAVGGISLQDNQEDAGDDNCGNNPGGQPDYARQSTTSRRQPRCRPRAVSSLGPSHRGIVRGVRGDFVRRIVPNPAATRPARTLIPISLSLGCFASSSSHISLTHSNLGERKHG